MKKLLFSTFAASALLLAGCSNDPEVASTEAGRIREAELYEAMKDEPLQSGMTVGETVLQKLLMEDIFEHTYGDQVTDEDVDEEFATSAEQFGSVEDYESLLEMQGMDVDYIKDNIRLSLLIRAAVEDSVEVTDEEVESLYEEQTPDYTAQHILVEDEDVAKDIIAQLDDGADFAELVEEYSTDPGSLETEGKYTFSEGEMVPEFEEAVDALEVDETTSEPVKTDNGYHVIRRLELEYAPLEDQREDLEAQILDNYTNDDQFMSELVSKLAKEANVQIADDDLKGAMSAYMPQDEEEEPADDTEELPAEESDNQTDEDADTEENTDAEEDADTNAAEETDSEESSDSE